jgi:hypothetical protein
LLGTLIFAQTYRYLRVSDRSERQQTKWVVFGFSAAIILWVGIVLADEVVLFFTQAGDLGVLYTLVSRPAMQLASLLVPLSIGVAIVRYSLWDIDIIINRTLVYGALTTLLGLIYFGGVTLLQGVFRTLTGQGDTLAIVASTLVIAALFTPLRRRIQSFIDRRFYRRKYDAAKTLAAFNARLRDETDLNALSAALVEVTQVTMQPEHASLWLRPEAAQKAERAD